MTAAVLTRRALRELRQALRRVGVNDPAAARDLNDAVHKAAVHIGGHPAMGTERPALAPLPYRFWPLHRYGIFLAYSGTETPPRILRIVSAARDLPLLLGYRHD